MTRIHQTAIVDSSAQIAADVEIGPFCIVESDVVIGSGCQLGCRSVVKTGTTLGENNVLSEGAVVGGRPQHLLAGATTGRLLVGKGNTFRENVTIHCGFGPEDYTTIGDENLFMVNSHVGHDSTIGSNCIIANNVMIAGHVTVENRVYISGAVGIHQFCRIGQLAMVGGQAHVSQDIPPFVTVDGLSTEIVGLNKIGLRRNGYTTEEVKQLKAAYRIIYRSGLRWDDVLSRLKEEFEHGPATEFHKFLSVGKRGFVQERRTAGKATLKLYDAQPQQEVSVPVRDAG